MYQPPNPETRDCRVSGIGCPELGTWDNLGRSIQFDSQSNILSSEFRTPEPQDCRVSGIGCPELRTRNSFRVQDTRYPRPGSLGFRGLGVRNSELGLRVSGLGTPETRKLKLGT
ncbi:hypothetical protein EV424DRAFT_1346350 [Suillus variegatus]|nr:hypothetical protein EV424DRAFT_1346350 [Suillus variegatus]